MRFVVRTDASQQIGTGHLARCHALADGLRERGARVSFVCRHLTPGARERLEGAGHEVTMLRGGGTPDELTHASWLGGSQTVDAEQTLAALANGHVDAMVVDHYALDARWESTVRSTAGRLMVIDDLADRDHDCDLLLDQNLYPDMLDRYRGRVHVHCRQLLGPRYALLRPEFAQARKTLDGREGRVRRVLVFFGGADAANHTGRVIDLLPSLLDPVVAVDVVIGISHPAREQIVAACERTGYRCHVQTPYMAKLMTAADLAIGAGGTATWERCCTGLPSLVWAIADNQRKQVVAAAEKGLIHAPDSVDSSDKALALQLGALLGSPSLLRAMSRAGMETVDARGLGRVCRALGCTGIDIRPARAEDCDQAFDWRNRLEVRAVSLSQAPIERAAHDVWFARALASEDRHLLIGEREHVPVGVVRFDIEGDEAEVSIYLAPGYAATGTGSDLLCAAEQWLSQAQGWRVCKILANVVGSNEISRRMFLAAGYRPHAVHFVKQVHPDD